MVTAQSPKLSGERKTAHHHLVKAWPRLALACVGPVNISEPLTLARGLWGFHWSTLSYCPHTWGRPGRKGQLSR